MTFGYGTGTWEVDPLITLLRSIRAEQKLSAVAASVKLDLALGTVAHWESGRRMPPLYKLRQYAALLGYDLALTPKARDEAES